MASGTTQTAKVKPALKNTLLEISEKTGVSMTDLIKTELRGLLKENNLPTI